MKPSIPFLFPLEYRPFPAFRATVGTFYPCKFCDGRGERVSNDAIVPCFACEQRGGLFAGELLLVDVAAQVDSQQRCIAVSRRRCPWGERLGQYDTSQGFASERAWGPHTLRRVLTRSAFKALEGVTITHLEPSGPIVWPETWDRATTLVPSMYEAIDRRLAALDGVKL